MKAKKFAVLKWSIIAILTSFVSSTVCTILLGHAASSICVLIGFIIGEFCMSEYTKEMTMKDGE